MIVEVTSYKIWTHPSDEDNVSDDFNRQRATTVGCKRFVQHTNMYKLTSPFKYIKNRWLIVVLRCLDTCLWRSSLCCE